MTDLTIVANGQTASMTFDKANSLYNNLWLSLRLARGSLFTAPTFGSRLHELKKITDNNVLLAADYCKDALKWLVATGRVASVNAVAYRDDNVENRIVLQTEIVKNDGTVASFEFYYSFY